MESGRTQARGHRALVLGLAAIVSAGALAAIFGVGRGSGASPLGAGAAATQGPFATTQASTTSGSGGSHFIGDLPGAPAARAPDGSPNGIATYIIVLDGQPLASYKGGLPGLPAPKRKLGPGGRYKLDTQGPEAVAYVAHLQARQKAFEARMGASLGTSVPVRMRTQHALDAVVVDLSARDAARVARMPGVRMVQAERDYPLETDTGPALIGAAQIWAGTAAGLGTGYRGEGMVVGIIDSGINFGAPSFSATGPVDGYVHVNPLGSGTYLGTCQAGGVDAGRCNAKLVGGYDFVCNAPANQCGVTDIREEPGFGDTSGHGTHVASIAAGNTRDVSFNGGAARISGVAPRANIVAYDVCYTKISTSEGLCPGSASLAAVNQAVSDGIVDAINFSIGGGQDPWGDAVSMAFLSAVDAGIYVATSGGNSGPTANTLSHLEPWVATTAAAQHGKGDFSVLMAVTGPAPVPANLSPVVATPGVDGVGFNTTIPGNTPLRISSGIDSGADACSAYPSNTLSGAIVVIRRGNCTFSVKANNASAAGAIAVVIANNQAGGLVPSVPGATIPVFAVTQAAGDALRSFGLANPSSATATLPYPLLRVANTPDVLGSFSSRGPAGIYELVKPDLTAPGVSILAAYAGTSITGSEGALGILDGTSMASPHNAGAAILVRQIRPSWTPPEVKSALMMTATDQVWTEDGVTPANAFAAGAGRIRVANAINAGLVINETVARFNSFDPLSGLDMSGMNLPSMAERSCTTTCSFTRTFRSTRTYGSLWQVGLQGLSGSAPSLVWVPAGSSVQVVVTIDAAALPADGAWRFGKLVLQERFTGQIVDATSELHLPIAILKPSAKAAAIGPLTATGSVSAAIVGARPPLLAGTAAAARGQAVARAPRAAAR